MTTIFGILFIIFIVSSGPVCGFILAVTILNVIVKTLKKHDVIK